MNALEILAVTKAKADARANYEQFVSAMRADGWTDTDVTEYREAIAVLMGTDDAAALALYPPGCFSSAEQARQAARDYWAKSAQSSVEAWPGVG